MATPAVQAASCAGAATAVITTTVVVVPTADARPKCFIYSSNNNVTTSSKLGKDVWMLLVDAKNSNNKDWWEWSFRQLQAHKNKVGVDAFKNLTSGFDKDSSDGTQNSKALNKLCHYHFKETATTTISATPVTDATSLAIWKYCSTIEKPPVLISDKEATEYGASNLGTTKKSELISYSDFQNSNFWQLKNEWFQLQKPTDEFFKHFVGKEEGQNLKEACKTAYSTTKANNGNPTATKTNPVETDVVKYCGFKVTQ